MLPILQWYECFFYAPTNEVLFVSIFFYKPAVQCFHHKAGAPVLMIQNLDYVMSEIVFKVLHPQERLHV